MAAIMPLAAAAGTPIPGIQLSPHTVKPGTGVLLPGQFAPPAAEMAGPVDADSAGQHSGRLREEGGGRQQAG